MIKVLFTDFIKEKNSGLRTSFLVSIFSHELKRSIQLKQGNFLHRINSLYSRYSCQNTYSLFLLSGLFLSKNFWAKKPALIWVERLLPLKVLLTQFRQQRLKVQTLQKSQSSDLNGESRLAKSLYVSSGIKYFYCCNDNMHIWADL